MATVLELSAAGALIKLEAELENNELEHRLIHALPHMGPRIENELPIWESDWDVSLTPRQQYDALLEIYCSGETLTYDTCFKPLKHKKDGIWELKTADLRLFGWFWVKDCFIVSAIDLTNRVKTGLYNGYIEDADWRRARLDLDEPKYVPGQDPNNVVTGYSFA
jgi:hypothetical protein